MSFTIFYNEKAPFQAVKTTSVKSRQIDIFAKGLTQAFGRKMADIPSFFFGNICQKNVFYDILERKNALLDYKKNKIKKGKNSHFFKGVNPWFWSKNGRFSNLILQAIQATKMSITIFQNEKTPFQTIKRTRSKRRKIDIFSKGLTHGFGPKMAFFPSCFGSGNIGHENIFYDILERKIVLLGYKNKKFKKSKN